jgi:predicted nucleotidyltransferase
MGMTKKTFGLSDALFSKVQQRVMALLFGQPDRSFYTSEILRHVDSGVGAVDRELTRLQRCGLVTVERVGNQKHFRANKQAPVFEDLRGLLEKTVNVTEPLKKSFERHASGIRSAFVFGSVAKGSDRADSDVDVLVIGDDLNYSDLYTAAQEAELTLKQDQPIAQALFYRFRKRASPWLSPNSTISSKSTSSKLSRRCAKNTMAC